MGAFARAQPEVEKSKRTDSGMNILWAQFPKDWIWIISVETEHA